MTHPRHVLHENSEGLFIVIPQTAVVLNNALMMQIFQQLDFALQSADLLNGNNDKQVSENFKDSNNSSDINIKSWPLQYELCIFHSSLGLCL